MRFAYLALAHVSHFSEPESWAFKQSTHFSLFELFEILLLPALLLSLAPRVALFPEREPWAHKQSTHFSPNDLRCGFRKLKEPGVGKSGFWGRPGAEILVVVVVVVVIIVIISHADAGRDPILPTQRILDIKICMVWICMVKVRFAYFALAHVSHFFCRTGAVGLQTMDAFSRF